MAAAAVFVNHELDIVAFHRAAECGKQRYRLPRRGPDPPPIGQRRTPEGRFRPREDRCCRHERRPGTRRSSTPDRRSRNGRAGAARPLRRPVSGDLARGQRRLPDVVGAAAAVLVDHELDIVALDPAGELRAQGHHVPIGGRAAAPTGIRKNRTAVAGADLEKIRTAYAARAGVGTVHIDLEVVFRVAAPVRSGWCSAVHSAAQSSRSRSPIPSPGRCRKRRRRCTRRSRTRRCSLRPGRRTARSDGPASPSAAERGSHQARETSGALPLPPTSSRSLEPA